jgi:hypothetical protein
MPASDEVGSLRGARPPSRDSTRSKRTTPGHDLSARGNVAKADNSGWSLYGARRSQPVATGSTRDGSGNGSLKRKPLPSVASSCLSRSMVSRASAVGCHPLREVPSLRRRGSTRGPLSAGFRRALTQATHYSTIMHDLLFARASINRASLTAQAVRRRPHDQHHQQADVRQYFGPAFLVDGSSLALASPRLMNGARRPGEKTLAQSSHLSPARVALSHEVPRRSTPHHRRQ